LTETSLSGEYLHSDELAQRLFPVTSVSEIDTGIGLLSAFAAIKELHGFQYLVSE
jgi:hypothetical protein